MSGRYGDRVERRWVQRIEALPEVVFPLLCPVREAEWLDEWTCEMIHSQSGVAEDDCVFRTRRDGQPATVWTVTRHDAAAGVVEFVRMTGGDLVTRLRLVLEPAPGGATAVHVRYVHTPASETGAALVAAELTEEKFAGLMRWWERSMNHYLATGSTLRAG